VLATPAPIPPNHVRRVAPVFFTPTLFSLSDLSCIVTVFARLAGITRPVTTQTPRHRQIAFAEQTIPLGHLAMAVLAFGAGTQMKFVAEVHEIRLSVDPNPGNLLLIAIQSGELSDRRAIRLNGSMAAHAFGRSG
jgi:hypothetical protein